ncbi:hypothetical protein YSY43_25840 [Paenibacillus sp. YSY-4.3]
MSSLKKSTLGIRSISLNYGACLGRKGPEIQEEKHKNRSLQANGFCACIAAVWAKTARPSLIPLRLDALYEAAAN